MDAVQRQIYQVVPKEALPYEFTTVVGFAFYVLPSNCDRFGIKEITLERSVGSGKFDTLPFISLESNQSISPKAKFYSVQQDKLFLNPLPTAEDEGRRVFILYNSRPAALTTLDLTATPELEEDFHELLTLGVLEKIARARGEIDDKNNFASDYNLLFSNYKDIYKLRQPDYYKPNDNLPRRRGVWNSNKWSRDSRIADLIPPGV
jgi:hypothetical protein